MVYGFGVERGVVIGRGVGVRGLNGGWVDVGGVGVVCAAKPPAAIADGDGACAVLPRRFRRGRFAPVGG